MIGTDSSETNPAMAARVYNVSEPSSTTPTLQVRVEYLGPCVLQVDDGIRLCSSSATMLANTFRDSAYASSADPLDLIYIEKTFRGLGFRFYIIFDGLIFIVIPLALVGVLAFVTVPGWIDGIDENGEIIEIKRFLNRNVLFCCGCIHCRGCISFDSHPLAAYKQ
ncbi:hypothetical protein BO82DRAFT_428801 [Aspergillus uvarum CBS 121591]|uniref:Uncharacterized protein n=1 Tax=Aspergillus uvarum CBS 121591 TaxID=1448315 RepID=A0A319CMK2_9EURO|nr:hypothetical protein BO82DRAFT_428801 [Aspergillus uvarum CBS 121591]PYH85800.1 hypothetical protein BO82DRAFT_428801 [Aspergillus uvarum CBS 121591]